METVGRQKKSQIQTDCSPSILSYVDLEKVIIGIDPGFKNLGWSIAAKVKNELIFLASGVCDLCDPSDVYKPKVLAACIDDFFEQLLKKNLKEVIGAYDPDVDIVIEQQYWNPKQRAASSKLLILQGAIVGYLYSRFPDTYTNLVTSSAVKKHYGICTGDRLENKARMEDLLKEKFGIDVRNEHVADCYLLTIFWAEKN